GAGLGLAIASALVTAHGGDLELETAPGAGALFRVRLRSAGH
ncbi:ATP-binding protein, partial [Streptomyces sp. NPDC059656]